MENDLTEIFDVSEVQVEKSGSKKKEVSPRDQEKRRKK
jgi:hypothetical protein